jgi:hypothetical protein
MKPLFWETVYLAAWMASIIGWTLFGAGALGTLAGRMT